MHCHLRARTAICTAPVSVYKKHLNARAFVPRIPCRRRAAIAAAAAADPDNTSSSAERRNQAAPDNNSRDRRAKRKPSTPQPTTVLQSNSAAAAGPLPEVLAATFPETFPTLSAARRVIRKDLVLVDGQLGSCQTVVAVGQQLEQLQPVTQAKAPRTISLQVLFEDDHLAVVHKPWGVKMYGGDSRRTVTGALRSGALAPSSSEDALPEPKAVHRLDAAVGGVLVVAKTASAAADISRQFVERRVHKVYHALLCGRLEPGTAAAAVQQEQRQRQQGNAVDGLGGPSSMLSNSASASMSTTSDSESAVTAVTDNEASVTGDESYSLSESEEQQQGDEEEGDGLQLPPLQELLQRQLQGGPAFDPTPISGLQPAETPTNSGSSSSSGSSGSSSSSAEELDSSSLLGSPCVHVVDLPVDGKTSYSLYQVLGYSRSGRFGGWATTVALSPVTGRKHQLRKHMAALGCPIVGDGKYSLNKDEHIANQGIYLEALEVAFTHPTTRERLHVRMPEPPRFTTMRQQLENRWRKLQAAAAAAASADSSSAQ